MDIHGGSDLDDIRLPSNRARHQEEYGNVSDVLHAKAELKFHSLRKKPTTSIQSHIDEFTNLHEEVEYHSPPGTNPMSIAQVDLAFLRSLGEKVEIFQQAMGDRAYNQHMRIIREGESNGGKQ